MAGRRARHTIRGILGGLTVLWLALSPSAHADDIQYAYDKLGRLIQATNVTSGEVVTYSYDAVGNITSQIARSLTELSLTSFSPQQGLPGTQVTIVGTGFSTTPAGNIVRFNGTSATLVSASQTQLVAVVPATASTGPVSVQVGTETVTGGTFIVGASSDAPTITALLPAAGTAGSTVTILGSNFELAPDGNRTRFGVAQAQVITSTASAITARVPANASSGKVRVSTPLGTAVSTDDFIVVPPGYTASRIASVERMAADETASTVTFPTSSKIALRLFEGATGDLLTVGISGLSFPSLTLKVFAPDGVQIASGTVSNSAPGLQLPKLPLTGTYTVVADAGGHTGSLAISIFPPLERALTVDAAATSIAIAPPGRRVLLSLDGTENMYVQVTLSAVTVSTGKVSILKPDGTLLHAAALSTTGFTLQPRLPSDGTYRVLIDPTGSIGGSFNVAVTTSATPQLVVNGTHDLQLTNQSPQAITFRATQGQYLALNVSTEASQVRGASIRVLGPDGAQLGTGTLLASSINGAFTGSGIVNVGPLQIGGTYTAIIQQIASGSGTVRLTLSTPAPGSLTPNAPTVTAAITTPGRGLLYTFSGQAGQQLTIRVSEKEQQINAAVITALRPDGSVLATVNLTTANTSTTPEPNFSGAAAINMGPLPVSGDYRILVQQTGMGRPNTGQLRLDLTTPVTGTLTLGVTTQVQIRRSGQGLQYSFTADAEQILALRLEFAGLIKAAAITVLNPEGEPVATESFFPTVQGTSPEHPEPGFYGSLILNLGPLPVGGTYTVLMRAAQWIGGPTTLSLVEPGDIGTVFLTLSTPLTGTLAANGATASIPIHIPGQGLLHAFTGNTGQYMTLAVLADAAANPNRISAANITVLKPDGSALATSLLRTAANSRGATVNLGPLPVSGSYKVLLQQTARGSPDVGTLLLTLSAPLSGTLVPNQPVSSVPIAVRGQGLRYQFSGQAGEYLALVTIRRTAGIVLAPVTVLNPDGSVYLTGNTEILNLGPLPVSGTYEVLVQQSGETVPGVGTLDLSISRPVAGALAVGPPVTVPVSFPGQGILHTFTAAVGEHVAVKVTEQAGSFIPAAKLTLIAPGGIPIKNATLTATPCSGCAGYTGVAEISLIAAPLTGTYAILVQQVTAVSPGTGTFALELNAPSVGSGTSWEVNTATAGEIANLTFPAVAGQSVSVTVRDLVFTPSNPSSLSVSIVPPAGPAIYSSSCAVDGTGCVVALRNLPQTGTYTFRVQPPGQVRMAFKATVTPALTGALVPGAATSISLTPVGQMALLSFRGVTGQSATVHLANVVTAPVNKTLLVRVINSAGTVLQQDTVSSAATLHLPNLTDEIYSVWIVPNFPATTNLQITLQTETIASLPSDASAVNMSTSVSAQRAYLKFAAIAGQSMSLALSELVLTPTSTFVFISISKPDGGSLFSTTCSPSGVGCVVGMRNLPQTGTYRVTVQPSGSGTMSFAARLSPAITGTLTPGAAQSINLSALGQPALLSFTAPGSSAALHLSGITATPANTALSVQVYNSANTQIAGITSSSATTLNLTQLEPGTYSVWIVPAAPATGSLQATLHASPSETLPDDGTAVSVTTAAPGQFSSLTFSAVAGESLSLVFDALTLIPSATGQITVNVIRPDGAQVTGVICPVTGVGCVIGLRNLPQNGMYTVRVQPVGMTRMSFDVIKVPVLTGSLSAGVPLNVTLSKRGQASLLHFTTAQQPVTLRFTSVTTAPINTALSIQVYNSAGTVVAAGTASSTLNLNVPNTAPDTYAIWIVPVAPASSSFQVSY